MTGIYSTTSSRLRGWVDRFWSAWDALPPAARAATACLVALVVAGSVILLLVDTSRRLPPAQVDALRSFAEATGSAAVMQVYEESNADTVVTEAEAARVTEAAKAAPPLYPLAEPVLPE